MDRQQCFDPVMPVLAFCGEPFSTSEQVLSTESYSCISLPQAISTNWPSIDVEIISHFPVMLTQFMDQAAVFGRPTCSRVASLFLLIESQLTDHKSSPSQCVITES